MGASKQMLSYEFRRTRGSLRVDTYLCAGQPFFWHSLLQYIGPEHPAQRFSLFVNSDWVRRQTAQRSAITKPVDGVVAIL